MSGRLAIEPFAPRHLDRLRLQPHQAAFAMSLSQEGWAHIADGAWTLLADGEPLAAAGVLDLGGGRGECWALLSEAAGPHMTALTRAIRRALLADPHRYLQAHVASNFTPAVRWVKMVGFRFAGRLPRYCDDGSDAEVWTRTR